MDTHNGNDTDMDMDIDTDGEKDTLHHHQHQHPPPPPKGIPISRIGLRNYKLRQQQQNASSSSSSSSNQSQQPSSTSQIRLTDSAKTVSTDADLRLLSPITHDTDTPQQQQSDEAAVLGDLVGVADQLQLERDIMHKVDQAMKEKDDAADQKRLEKTRKELGEIQRRTSTLEQRLRDPSTRLTEKHAIIEKLGDVKSRYKALRKEENEILDRMREREGGNASTTSSRKVVSSTVAASSSTNTTTSTAKQSTSTSLPNPLKSLISTTTTTTKPKHPKSTESERERLIRLGKITPFDHIPGMEKHITKSTVQPVVEDHRLQFRRGSGSGSGVGKKESEEEVIDITGDTEDDNEELETQQKPTPKKKQRKRSRATDSEDEDEEEEYNPSASDRDDDFIVQDDDDDEDNEEEEEELDFYNDIQDSDSSLPSKPGKSRLKDVHHDDGDETVYIRRLKKWATQRRLKRLKKQREVDDSMDDEDENDLTANAHEEMFAPSPNKNDAVLEGGYKCPGDIYENLFDYQKTTIKWLWELHCQEVGGIIGDEMGLGKTIQIISFLAGLGYSKLLKGPVLVVCPATVLKQWVAEFHRWWPPFRVAIMHGTGSGMVDGILEEDDEIEEEDEEEDTDYDNNTNSRKRKKRKAASSSSRKAYYYNSDDDDDTTRPRGKLDSKMERLIDRIVTKGHVLITTYAAIRVHRSKLAPIKWSYVVLDEGHKIRNPDADITLACKQLRTPHRIILSGTPIQNNLTELWSLFDFVFPGRLGTLPVFQQEFSLPINLGGYANASNMQVQAAYKCAVVLRDLINPYLLRRMKIDVATDLPTKTEQVLFVRLTSLQRRVYYDFLESRECQAILDGRRHVLYGIDLLRKICNHPDLILLGAEDKKRMAGGAAAVASAAKKLKNANTKPWEKKTQRGKSKVISNMDYSSDEEDDEQPFGHLNQYMDGDEEYEDIRSKGSRKKTTFTSRALNDSHRSDGSNNIFGDWQISGKMRVVKALLELWWFKQRDEQHKVLLFCQTRQMQTILEKMLNDINLPYRRMDGTTNIKNRMAMVEEFNATPSENCFVFLLTTKVGGLGLNLTSADKVILFDPDWNPSTDVQARERAWRLGQKRPVTIYRLMTAGTIEEKILQRQIFKTYLASRILKDPKQKRFFKSNELRELFTLTDQKDGTETGDLFAGLNAEVNANGKRISSSSSSSSTKKTSRDTGKKGRRNDSYSDTDSDNEGGYRDQRRRRVTASSSSSSSSSRPLNTGSSSQQKHGDVDEIEGIARVDQQSQPQRPTPSSPSSSKTKPTNDAEDMRVLEWIGVHSALKHDVIMDTKSTAEGILIEKEASKVANRAIAVLKQSRKMRRRTDIAVPTWTGRSGRAGAPGTGSRSGSTGPRFGATSSGMRGVSTSSSSSSLSSLANEPSANPFGPKVSSTNGSGTGLFGSNGNTAPLSSSTILASLRDRSDISAPPVASSSSSALQFPNPSSSTNHDEADMQTPEAQMAIKIRDFIYEKGGEAKTDDVVKVFGKEIQGRENVLVFKKILKEVADFKKDTKKWVLKEEYY